MTTASELDHLQIPAAWNCTKQRQQWVNFAHKADTYTCLECNQPLVLVAPSKDSTRAKHFRHAAGASNCAWSSASSHSGGGEGSRHKYAKTLLTGLFHHLDIEWVCAVPGCGASMSKQQFKDTTLWRPQMEVTIDGKDRVDVALYERKTGQVCAVFEVKDTHAMDKDKCTRLWNRFPNKVFELEAEFILETFAALKDESKRVPVLLHCPVGNCLQCQERERQEEERKQTEQKRQSDAEKHRKNLTKKRKAESTECALQRSLKRPHPWSGWDLAPQPKLDSFFKRL